MRKKSSTRQEFRQKNQRRQALHASAIHTVNRAFGQDPYTLMKNWVIIHGGGNPWVLDESRQQVNLEEIFKTVWSNIHGVRL